MQVQPLTYYGGPFDGASTAQTCPGNWSQDIEDGEEIGVDYRGKGQPMMTAFYKRTGDRLVFVRTDFPLPD